MSVEYRDIIHVKLAIASVVLNAIKPATSRAPERESGWRPIETAPKDGTEVFIWNPKWAHPVKAAWKENQGVDENEEDIIFYGWSFDEFINLGGCEDGFLGWNEDIEDGLMPTLWMGLPV